MDNLTLTQTNETPAVELSAKEGKFSFSGKSYPENVNEFYSEILKYLNTYAQDPTEKTTLIFNFLYYNTATSKIIVKIIMELRSVLSKGKQFQIKWICKSNDELMKEKGEELKDLLDVDFGIIHE